MPFPLLPFVGFAVSGSLVAYGVKVIHKRRKNSNQSQSKTFAKYAHDHRVREKAQKSLQSLLELKESVQICELARFQDIFENILHVESSWEFSRVEKEDYSPLITSAPLSEAGSLGGAADWAHSVITDLRSQLKAFNDKMKDIVLQSGFDFNQYSYLEKGIVLSGLKVASQLQAALQVTLLDENGNFRDQSIDELEEIVTEGFAQAA